MNIKNKISQIFGRESHDLRQILLADKVTAETIEKAKSLIFQLEQSSKDLTKKTLELGEMHIRQHSSWKIPTEENYMIYMTSQPILTPTSRASLLE